MATIKNFGLAGVSSTLQLGKGGGKLKFDAGSFAVRNAADDALVNVQVAEPVVGDDAATKQYVDDAVSDAFGGLVAGDGIEFNTETPGTTVISTRINTESFQYDLDGSLALLDIEPGGGDNGEQLYAITIDGKGRVASRILANDATIISALGYTPVDTAGDTMSGDLNMGGNTVTGLAAPTADSDAATKQYVDDAVAGLVETTGGAGITVTAGEVSIDLAASSGLELVGVGAAAQLAVDLVSGDLALSGNEIGLADVTDSGVGTFVKVTVDAKGRVTGTEAVDATDIDGVLGYTPADDAEVVKTVNGLAPTLGNVVIGLSDLNDFDADGNRIINVGTPTDATDAANKAYVDSVASGLNVKAAARAATTVDITLSGLQTIDGVVLVAGDRVLVKNQTNTALNGIYDVVDGGAWTRAEDFNEPSEITGGEFIFVKEGTTQADTGWVVATPDGEIGTIGTDPIVFVQFSSAGVIQAGAGLSQTGNVFNVGGTTGRIVVNADSIDLDSTAVVSGEYGDAATAVTFTVDQFGRLTAASETAIAITNSQVTDFDAGIDAHLSGSTAGVGVDVTYTAGVIAANLDFQNLDGETTLADDDLFAFYDDSAAGYRSVTGADLKAYAQAGLSQNTITQGDTSVTVTDTGTDGTITFTADGVVEMTVDSDGVKVNNLTAGQVVFAGTDGVLSGDADLTYTAGTLAIGDLELSGNTITTSVTDGDINLVPNGTGQVVIGNAGPAVIASDALEDLTISAGEDLILEGTTITLDVGTSGAATYAGVAADVATAIVAAGDNAIVNKLYVDDAIADAVAGSELTAGDGIDITAGVVSVDIITGELAFVSGELGLADVTDSGTGTFLKFARDGKGRVTGTTAVVEADITALVDDVYVNVAGDTMEGDLNMGGFTVTGLAAPAADTDAATKLYVDTAVANVGISGVVDTVTLSLSGATGTVNFPSAVPANSTSMRIRVAVSSAADAGVELTVNEGGSNTLMTVDENDLQEVGIYVAEIAVFTGAIPRTYQAVITGGSTGNVQITIEYRNA